MAFNSFTLDSIFHHSFFCSVADSNPRVQWHNEKDLFKALINYALK
jgi:hypothetical protein